ncbi:MULTISPECIES: hypothetical protein [unclassified Breznakia]|uniref:hypothetical protein n=1 Tax=unclassified Breznakia TaxID=2623764 RepID=UPI002477195C|nr:MULTISPECIES: hypothetical protein [unclassified Breznakia]MDH6367536.1 hypothetical protein [Breznakia sp. PH1-1]MDH6404670.1 hypothetical protein [Breznakia sp. PF1-11]MDH6412366.1 hypothetical protein [Breznakia sp. PFB1-11]MDH6414704.1 hypothetical protein [Breznakia sp. PFB1-14]MDH6417051.1 hypothetical protein [Breznakia sp. PFB1-4]
MIQEAVKKQIKIEFVVYDGTNINELKDFVGNDLKYDICDTAWQVGKGIPHIVNVRIQTLEGDMNVSKGDYVIKGVQGEFYPCKPDIFEATYDKVEE